MLKILIKSHTNLQIYTYNEYGQNIEDDQFLDRVDWNGSKTSNDIQDASIYLLNVTFNDSGTYRCLFNRRLLYGRYEYDTNVIKLVHLTVVAKGKASRQFFSFTRLAKTNLHVAKNLQSISLLMWLWMFSATRGTASIVSEVMMYVSIIGLQVWLLIEMIYCYRKIAAAGEEALREAA